MLSVSPPGDYNRDDVVDAADYVLWRKASGTTVAVAGDGADGNKDGAVGPEDYNVWRANIGAKARPDNWFDVHIQDMALRSLGSDLYVDGLIDRSDILALFQVAKDGELVDVTEFNDLAAIASNNNLFGTPKDVGKLTSYVVFGNSANANYQGQALGNLAAGSTASQLTNLVNKWFLGLDRPVTPYNYEPAAGQLFVNGPSYADIAQGSLNNCAFMAALAETALRSPDTINDMFVINGDGTYTVRFYHDGVAEYVTVDSYLPAAGGAYASVLHGELWAALAEKAYAQVGELSWFERSNSYAAIESMVPSRPLAQITGKTTVAFTGTEGAMNLSKFVAAYNAGKLICLASYINPPSTAIVSNHVYAVVGYEAASQTVTLFNPWGISSGLTILVWNQVEANFEYFDRTA